MRVRVSVRVRVRVSVSVSVSVSVRVRVYGYGLVRCERCVGRSPFPRGHEGLDKSARGAV